MQQKATVMLRGSCLCSLVLHKKIKVHISKANELGFSYSPSTLMLVSLWTDLWGVGVGQLGWNTSSSSVSRLSILHSGTRHLRSPSWDRRRFQLLLRLPELRDRRRQGERQGPGRGDMRGERRGERRGDARKLELVCKENGSKYIAMKYCHDSLHIFLLFIES